MVTQFNTELRFIDYSVNNYTNVFIELLNNGKKHFLVQGMNDDAIEFLKKAREYRQSYLFNFFALPNCRDIPCPEEINYNFEINEIEVVFVFIADANKLSSTLMEYSKLKNCIVVAPITKHYFKNRPVFIQSIPKSGTHMLFECIKAFGFNEPPFLALPKYNDTLEPGYFYNLQHMTPDYIALPYSKIGKFIQVFCNSVILYIYRDPRDIAVSLSHYLASQKQYHILYKYMKNLSQGDRLTTVIKGDYPIPVYINDNLMFSGNIRELALLYSNWLKYPLSNLIPIKFEDLVGPKGGGDFGSQLLTIWTLQLGLHVPGKPNDFSEKIFSEKTLTFRKGKIGNYLEEFTAEHTRLFKMLPQDFMEIYGYGEELKAERKPLNPLEYFTGSVPIGEIYTIPVLFEEGYKGFNIVFYEDKYYALSQCLGHLDLIYVEENTIKEYQETGNCFVGVSIDEVKQMIDHQQSIDEAKQMIDHQQSLWMRIVSKNKSI